MTTYPRALHQPSGGSPRWVNQGEGSLRYLSWGWRRYGKHPIPPTLHDGWIYQLQLSSPAVAQIGDRRVPVAEGSLLIVGRSCPSGWTGRGRCKILSWIWRDAPLFEAIRPPEDGFRLFALTADTVRQIARLHRQARIETTLSDDASDWAASALKIQIDTALTRAARPGSPDRLAIARRWLRAHPEEMHPVSALSEHLQVSAATLNRLFRAKLGHGVRQEAYAIRMELARRLIADGRTVKDTAFQLGYRNPNDLTRAFSKFFKQPPSTTAAQKPAARRKS